MTMTDHPLQTPLIACAGTYYRWTRYLMSAMLVLGGLWFMYDGYIGWPRLNDRIAELEKQQAEADNAGDTARSADLYAQRKTLGDKKNHASILLQRVLGWGLPPLGIALLVWTLYNSRSSLRLGDDDVLHAPGHPPVPLDAITTLDSRLWQRKGIARVGYTLTDGKSGVIRLDDFVYQRPPTDAIYDRIKTVLESHAPSDDVPPHNPTQPLPPADEQ